MRGTGRGDDVRAPSWPAIAALVCAAGSALVALRALTAGGSVAIPPVAVGYGVGALGSILFACVYRALRNARRGHGQFRPQPWLDRAVAGLMTLGILAGLVNAFLLATELAK